MQFDSNFQRTQTNFLSDRPTSRQKIGVNILFLSDCFSAHIPDLPSNFLSERHLPHTDRFFVVRSSEKSRSEGPIFSRTGSAHTTDFLSQAAPRKNRSDFFSDQKSAHTDRYFIGAIVCDNSRGGLIVG